VQRAQFRRHAVDQARRLAQQCDAALLVGERFDIERDRELPRLRGVAVVAGREAQMNSSKSSSEIT
jgi:hypothetical protein